MSENNIYTYKYPHPAVTTDCVIFGYDGKELKVLLVERGLEPYQGMLAFPGGFMKMDETLEECALRELKEETALEVERLEQFHAFSSVNRDPRERVISVAFFGLVKMSEVRGGDDARSAQWIALDKVPNLAFDHDFVLRIATSFLKKKIFFEPIGFDLLDETFTFPQLQRLYETILGVKFDRRNFKRKILQLGLIEEDDSTSVNDDSKPINELLLPAGNDSCEDKLLNDSLTTFDIMPKSKLATSHEVGRKPQKFKFNKKRYEELKEDPSCFRLEF